MVDHVLLNGIIADFGLPWPTMVDHGLCKCSKTMVDHGLDERFSMVVL